MSNFNCCFLTCIQFFQDPGQIVCYSQLLKNFPQFVVIRIVKGFNVVNEADVFLELFAFFMIQWIMEKGREFQKNIYFCFIDYAKAFDCVDHQKLWNILKEMGIPDHLTCLLRNLYAGQEATVRTRYRKTDWFKIGKGVHQGCISPPCLFYLYAEYIIEMLGWISHMLESRLPGEISIVSDMQVIPL